MRPLDCPVSMVAITKVVLALRQQRKTFYANGRFWVFYCDETNLAYKTSTDGENWSSATTVRASDNSTQFSIWFDGVHVHYAYASEGLGYSVIYYGRGTPNADGSISWSAEQTAIAAEADHEWLTPFVAVDSNGYPFITYHYRESPASIYLPAVTKSSANDGTWATASGFPYDLSTSWTDWEAITIPLTDGKMYAIYSHDSWHRGKLWSDSSWGGEETIATGAQDYAWFSAVNEGDDVHIVYLKATSYDLAYKKRTYGVGWGSEETVQSSTTSITAPLLSIDTINSIPYCFWTNLTDDKIYYKKRVDGTWDVSPTTFVEGDFQSLETGSDLVEQIYGSNWKSQSFISETNNQLYAVWLYVGWYDVWPRELTVSIYNADAEGRPTGAALASGTITGTSFDVACSWYRGPDPLAVIFSPPISVEANNKYCIVLSCPDGDSFHYFRWGVDSTSPPYTDGNWAYSANSGSTWTADTSKDALFRALFASTLYSSNDLVSFYKDYGSKIGLAFTAGKDPLYSVSFDFLTVEAPPPGLENKSANMAAKMVGAGLI